MKRRTKQHDCRKDPKNTRMRALTLSVVSLVALLFVTSGVHAESIVFKIHTSYCGDGYRIMTYAEAQPISNRLCSYQNHFIERGGDPDIELVRIAGGGSVDVSGGSCEIRANDDRSAPYVFCVKEKTLAERHKESMAAAEGCWEGKTEGDGETYRAGIEPTDSGFVLRTWKLVDKLAIDMVWSEFEEVGEVLTYRRREDEIYETREGQLTWRFLDKEKAHGAVRGGGSGSFHKISTRPDCEPLR